MTALNTAGLLLADHGVSAATDVTGFGLTGHALEMARAANLSFAIDTGRLPLLPEAVPLCGAGFTCGGTKANTTFTAASITYGEGLGNDLQDLLNDPQTSGGLLIAVPAARCEELCAAVLADGALCAAVIGEVAPRRGDDPFLRFF
jgi:selenide,water dikinase